MHKRGLRNPEYLQILKRFTEWLSRLNYAEESIRGRERHLRRFLSWVEGEKLDLEKVSRDNLYSYNEYLHAHPIGAKTIEAYLSALKLFNSFRENYGQEPLIKTRLSIDREVEIRRSILTVPEINALYQTCNDGPYGWRDRAILAVFYGCGLRCREGIYLEVKDVDFNTGLTHVRKGKNYRERYVPMSQGVRKDLQEWLNNYHAIFCVKTNWLVPSRLGSQMGGSGLNLRLEKLCREAEVKRITLHGLRHSIASHLLQSGMSLENIRLFLGHQSLETTRKYTHLLDEL